MLKDGLWKFSLLYETQRRVFDFFNSMDVTVYSKIVCTVKIILQYVKAKIVDSYLFFLRSDLDFFFKIFYFASLLTSIGQLTPFQFCDSWRNRFSRRVDKLYLHNCSVVVHITWPMISTAAFPSSLFPYTFSTPGRPSSAAADRNFSESLLIFPTATSRICIPIAQPLVQALNWTGISLSGRNKRAERFLIMLWVSASSASTTCNLSS